VVKRTLDLKEFARRVERLCDFFIAKRIEETGRDGSKDLKILEDLKQEAADIQFDDDLVISTEVFDGLYDLMNGAIQ
jgi:hypothetical protein